MRSLNALLCHVLQKIVYLHSIGLPVDMSSYKSTMIQCKSTSLLRLAIHNDLYSKVKKIAIMIMDYNNTSEEPLRNPLYE